MPVLIIENKTELQHLRMIFGELFFHLTILDEIIENVGTKSAAVAYRRNKMAQVMFAKRLQKIDAIFKRIQNEKVYSDIFARNDSEFLKLMRQAQKMITIVQENSKNRQYDASNLWNEIRACIRAILYFSQAVFDYNIIIKFVAMKSVYLGELLFQIDNIPDVTFDRYIEERQIRDALAMRIVNIGEILPKIIERDDARGIKNNPFSEQLIRTFRNGRNFFAHQPGNLHIMLPWEIYKDFPKLKTAVVETCNLEPGMEAIANKICEIMHEEEEEILLENKKV